MYSEVPKHAVKIKHFKILSKKFSMYLYIYRKKYNNPTNQKNIE